MIGAQQHFAGVESLVFVLAFGTVLSSLQDPVRIIAYGLGVAGGTLLGMVVDERLSNGRALVRLVVDGSGIDETTRLRDRGWPATRSDADGVNGPVSVITVAVDERVMGRLTHDLDRLTPDAFRTVERLRDVRPTVRLPADMHQPHGHRPRAAVR